MTVGIGSARPSIERELPNRFWTHGVLITVRDEGPGRDLSYCGAS